MKKTLFLIALIVTAFYNSTVAFADETTPAPAAAAAPAETKAPEFTGEALKIKQHIEELFKASQNVNKTGKEKEVAREKITNAMDWARITNDCLGKKKSLAKGGQLKEFETLLKEVILKTAFSRMDSFWKETKFEFQTIDVKGSNAHVIVRFVIKDEAFSLDYYLNEKGKKWSIYDISFEGLRYSENINEQLDAFLKEKGFANLIDKLKKRKAELDK